MFEFKLPDLGEGIHEGEILRWHVQPGQPVEEDAPLVDVETDKAAVTIPSPVKGLVATLGGGPGKILHTGEILVVFETGSAPQPIPPTVPSVAPSARAIQGDSATRVPAAPSTRRLARELGVAIHQVPPTGPAGRVTPDDVRRFADAAKEDVEVRKPFVKSQSPVPQAIAEVAESPLEDSFHGIPLLDIEPLPDFARQGPVELLPLRSIRRRTARKMVTSMILVPHVAHMDEIDVTDLEAFRRERREHLTGPGSRLTLLAFAVKAVVAALRRFPSFNASLDPFKEEIVLKRFYNIGIAVDTPAGLVVPVLHDAGRGSILDLSARMEALSDQARGSSLEADQMRGGTFTITNIGALGGTGMIPTINYPESAILGMARVQEKPVVRSGQIVVRRMLPVTLAFDHRIADGADAARFVNEIGRLLSDPAVLFTEA